MAATNPRASYLVGFLPVRDLVRPVERRAEDPLLGREGAPAQVDATGARHVTSIELVDVHRRRSDVAIGRDRELVVHGARDMDLGVCGLERPQRSNRSLRAQQLGVGGPASPRQMVVDHPPLVVGVGDELVETAEVADRSTVACTQLESRTVGIGNGHPEVVVGEHRVEVVERGCEREEAVQEQIAEPRPPFVLTVERGVDLRRRLVGGTVFTHRPSKALERERSDDRPAPVVHRGEVVDGQARVDRRLEVEGSGRARHPVSPHPRSEIPGSPARVEPLRLGRTKDERPTHRHQTYRECRGERGGAKDTH